MPVTQTEFRQRVSTQPGLGKKNSGGPDLWSARKSPSRALPFFGD
jgi:hypothetical protein